MTTNPVRIIATLGAALFIGGTLASCNNIGTPASQHDHALMGDSDSSEFSNQDIMFAQMMIPHHQQAVEMGTLAETRASSPKVKALAAHIKAEQTPEIEQMQSWLNNAKAPSLMAHDMAMDGMLSESEMAALAAASGAQFDQLYVAGMISHHRGAIQMAEMILNSNNPEVKALGEAIISSQTKQIQELESLLAR